MGFVLIIWFISQSAIAVTSAPFDGVEECREALRSIQGEFSGGVITVGGGCYRTKANP